MRARSAAGRSAAGPSLGAPSATGRCFRPSVPFANPPSIPYIPGVLLTLAARCLKAKLTPAKGARPAMVLEDVPKFARDDLGLSGLVLSTDLLVGADRQKLTKVLESADKAGCPCLVLVETEPQPFADSDSAKVEAAVDRCQRVAQAAHWLGCSAFAVPIKGADTDSDLLTAGINLKPVSRRAEKLDLNLCIVPTEGLTATPDRVTELLKKIGGFRVGTLPDFQAASASPEPNVYLRRLVPYASAVIASSVKFKPVKGKPLSAGKHEPYDLHEYSKLLVAVGYQGPVALDYRGSGELIENLVATRDIIASVITAEEPVDDEDPGLAKLLGDLSDDAPDET